MTIAAASLFSLLPIPLRRRPFSRFFPNKSGNGRCGYLRVVAVFGEEGSGGVKKSTWGAIFDVEDPKPRVLQSNGKLLDANQALEVARFDLQYCDWRAHHDLLMIMLLHDKVHVSEARVGAALDRLAYMESLVSDRLLQDGNAHDSNSNQMSLMPSTSSIPLDKSRKKMPQRGLNVSGPVQPYHHTLKNFWYPVAFSTDLKDVTMLPMDIFEESWVIFRGKDGSPGCIQNTCAHRACPLHLGSVNEGRIQCPYHGWEYFTDGKCEKMPSTRMLDVRIQSLPCFEHEGMVWVWPSDEPPVSTLPFLQPPRGFIIHAEIV